MKAHYERELREKNIRARLSQVSFKERHSRFNISIIPRLPLNFKVDKKQPPPNARPVEIRPSANLIQGSER